VLNKFQLQKYENASAKCKSAGIEDSSIRYKWFKMHKSFHEENGRLFLRGERREGKKLPNPPFSSHSH